MIPDDDPTLIANLDAEEGTGPTRNDRFYLYDDATGRELVPGTTLRGNATIGHGINLTGTGLSPREEAFIKNCRIHEASQTLTGALPWVMDLPLIPQRVMLDMAFNMGVGTLLTFHHFLSAVQAANWELAAQSIEDSLIPPDRKASLSAQMRSALPKP